MTSQQQLIIKMVLDSWNIYISRTNQLFSSLSDEQLQLETAPARNSGIYLLGHLAAVHDALFPILGFGEKLYPQLTTIFLDNPDKAGLEKPPAYEVRNYWLAVNTKLAEHFAQLTAEEWFQKHGAVKQEDFDKEPHRNKLNVIVNRTNHLSYHLGQLAYLKNN